MPSPSILPSSPCSPGWAHIKCQSWIESFLTAQAVWIFLSSKLLFFLEYKPHHLIVIRSFYIQLLKFIQTPDHPGHVVGWSIIPYTKRLRGSIPGQGTYLGCGFSLVGACMKDNKLIFLSFSPPSHLSLSTINKHILEWGFFKKPEPFSIK